MPLPNIKKQCTARNRRTGNRCKNPAAFGCKTCRYHGARQIQSGTDHPNYKHGQSTKAAVEAYQNKVKELDELEDLALSIGMVASRRWGRRADY